MKIKCNPMMNFDSTDELVVGKTYEIIDEFLRAIVEHTVTDNGRIVCADNGEVIITEEDAFATLATLNVIKTIMHEAPMDNNCRKILAVEFYD